MGSGESGNRRSPCAGSGSRDCEIQNCGRANSSGLAEFTPAEVAKRTGVKAERIERLAREFAENSPAIAIIGGTPLAHTNGMFNALAANALNALSGSMGKPGGMSFMPQPKNWPAIERIAYNKLSTEQLAGPESPARVLVAARCESDLWITIGLACARSIVENSVHRQLWKFYR